MTERLVDRTYGKEETIIGDCAGVGVAALAVDAVVGVGCGVGVAVAGGSSTAVPLQSATNNRRARRSGCQRNHTPCW
jgi:hypothetical protein